jgi:hypothetical protein
VAPLLEHLGGLGVLPGLETGGQVSSVERLLEDYGRYLLQERGFATSTAQRYVGFARRFVGWWSGGADGERDLDAVPQSSPVRLRSRSGGGVRPW